MSDTIEVLMFAKREAQRQLALERIGREYQSLPQLPPDLPEVFLVSLESGRELKVEFCFAGGAD